MIIEDIILLGIMGQPGGGRTNITARLLRHFNIISYTNLPNESVNHIFTTLANFFFSRFD